MDIESTLDKKEELCKLFEECLYEIHQKDQGEYHYLDEDDICITVKNSNESKVLYLDLNEEFTLTFGSFHSHYDCSEYDYEELVTDIREIIKSNIGVASIYHYYDGKLNWLGSHLVSIEETETKNVKQVFQHVFSVKDFQNDLTQYGGEVHYEFWDSRYDKTLMIDKNV